MTTRFQRRALLAAALLAGLGLFAGQASADDQSRCSLREQNQTVFVSFVRGANSDNDEDSVPARMELRRAETEPAEGLVEATVLGTNRKVYLHKTAELTAKDIQNVRAGGDALGKPTIEITFTDAGARKMTRLTRQHQGKLLAVMLGGKVLSAPTIRTEISKRAVVTGEFTARQFEQLLNAANDKQ